ncbi:hypothetical protein BDN71DRAFT_1433018 [Pleurotus eryngii]|uniref:Uncharacterized protein n=1 Tax=Pleurotus eryngii TaxID=5323 RepID=A0A9P5ZR73_PLEER|nr:hypothetical protein BDN71DRAFT_1433018 [Pleurotus eryngii]
MKPPQKGKAETRANVGQNETGEGGGVAPMTITESVEGDVNAARLKGKEVMSVYSKAGTRILTASKATDARTIVAPSRSTARAQTPSFVGGRTEAAGRRWLVACVVYPKSMAKEPPHPSTHTVLSASVSVFPSSLQANGAALATAGTTTKINPLRREEAGLVDGEESEGEGEGRTLVTNARSYGGDDVKRQGVNVFYWREIKQGKVVYSTNE